MARAEVLEASVHGRKRRYDADTDDLDEAHFGVHEDISLARGFLKNAQWTGVTTGIALAWLESGAVDAVVVAGADASGSEFAAPKPLLCRTPAEVLAGRRVKPSLCPSLEVLDEVAADRSVRRLLFCGVGCAVQALRAMNGGQPEAALGLEPDGLYVLGTHCVDNSPTPRAAREFVSALPGVGAARAADVLAYEFMADFRVHARLRKEEGVPGAADVPSAAAWNTDSVAAMGAESAAAEETVKAAYMTLPPSVGIPSIAPSCFSCFDYTNGLADLVVGYMGAPFDGAADEMTDAPLMVTTRNARGAAMLAEAVAARKVELVRRGGHGGRGLPSEGDRRQITLKTVRADSMVQSLTDPSYVPAERGAPPMVGNLLAAAIAKTLPKGMEFGRYSIDYHYLRNMLFVDERMGAERAARHVPAYAAAIAKRYEADMADVRRAANAPAGGGRGQDGDQTAAEWIRVTRELLLLL